MKVTKYENDAMSLRKYFYVTYTLLT